MSTPEEKLAAIAAILGDTAPMTASAPWFHATGLPPVTPLADASNEAEVKRYASFGYKFNLKRGVDPTMLSQMVGICDKLYAAPSPTAAEAIISGAGDFPVDVACYLVLTGATQGFTAFMSPSIFAPKWIQTITDAAYYAAAVPNPNGPGPSGQ